MPYSMTGFATAEALVSPFELNWELKSVNHRFLDVSFRLPDELRSMEPRLRDHLTAVVGRGKVDCTLKISRRPQDGEPIGLDAGVLARLQRLGDEVRNGWPDATPMSVAEILRWPGVLKEPEQEYSRLAGEVDASFAAAVESLTAARAREGGRIVAALEHRLDGMRQLLAEIEPKLAGASARHRDKLLERLSRLEVQAQPERLEQELALIAQRLDVAEEIDRLAGHITETADVLKRDEPIGRRLDFLIQELNREANTLASKVQDDELARRAVDLKVLIEQMREQVQNLE